MKRFFLPIFLVAITFPHLAFAANLELSEDYFLPKDTVLEGDSYIAAGNTTISGKIQGDLFSAGGTLFVDNAVAGDAFLLGGNLQILADVSGDVRIVSGKTLVGGNVGEDLIVVSGEVEILSGTTILGDVLISGGKVLVNGNITGNVKISGGEVVLNGVISGDTLVNADRLILGSKASLARTLSYASAQQAHFDEGAVVSGEVNFREISSRPKAEKFIPIFWGTWFLVKFAVLLVGALVLHGVFRRISDRFVHVGIEHFGRSLLWGFLFLVTVPVATILVILTFVGIPFVLLSASVYILILGLSAFYSAILIGSLARRLIKNEKTFVVTWKTILIGVVLSVFIDFIPYIGIAAKSVFFLVAVGSIITVLFHKFAEVR
jgi:cytoskeletal protein CcmA (bactofilin family)